MCNVWSHVGSVRKNTHTELVKTSSLALNWIVYGLQNYVCACVREKETDRDRDAPNWVYLWLVYDECFTL